MSMDELLQWAAANGATLPKLRARGRNLYAVGDIAAGEARTLLPSSQRRI
jgi:hypothetical protein